MYLALYALLTAAGAAIAWRSNPMYSLGRTLRFLAVTGLAVAVIVGAIIAVINATQRMSQFASGMALGITVLLGTLFFIWAIVTVSTPHAGPMPRGTKLVNVHRTHVVPWLQRVPIALVLLAFLVFVTRGDARILVAVFGGLFGFLAIVMVFTLFIAALGMDRSLTAVEAAPWIHWVYTPEAWSAWSDALVARTAARPKSWIWSRDWKKFVVPLAIVVVALLVLYRNVMPLLWSVSYAAGIVVFMAATIELSNRSEIQAPSRLRRLLRGAPPETYAGDAGIFCDGAYVQWLTPSNYLISATIDERAPRCIDLEFAQIVAGASTLRHFTQSVLIPPNADEDLRTLQARLTARCPDATIALAG
jgi:hypothetical protein